MRRLTKVFLWLAWGLNAFASLMGSLFAWWMFGADWYSVLVHIATWTMIGYAAMKLWKEPAGTGKGDDQ